MAGFCAWAWMDEAESAVENRKAAVRSEAVREGPLVAVTGVILPKLGANRYGLMGGWRHKKEIPQFGFARVRLRG